MPTHHFSSLQVCGGLGSIEGLNDNQPDGSHNNTVIERYVIVTISKLWKVLSKRHSFKKKIASEKRWGALLIKKQRSKGQPKVELEACLA